MVCQALASRDSGIVTGPQLVQAGVLPAQIQRWVARGLLIRLYHQVFAVGHHSLSPRAQLRAALLACGPRAVLSHGSALYLWGLRDRPPDPVDVTVLIGQRRPKPGIHLHRVSSLDERDVRRRDGLILTSPARTVIDQGAGSTAGELDRLVAEARVHGLLRPGELEAAVERAGRRSGVAAVRAVLAAETTPDFTRSEGERKLRRLLLQAGLPQPRSNTRAAGYEVDFLWGEARLVVEFDGFQFHGHRRAFERDRQRDVALVTAGYVVLRFTWRQLAQEPLAVIASIARALGRRSRAAH